MSIWHQTILELAPKPRGFHLITEEILSQLATIKTIKSGILHLFVQHCSASLTINENADPSVRDDLEAWTRRYISDHSDFFVHTYEGPDDMPAHVKASLFGPSVSIPICEGELMLGTWQGLYLGEHRELGGPRSVVATLNGVES